MLKDIDRADEPKESQGRIRNASQFTDISTVIAKAHKVQGINFQLKDSLNLAKPLSLGIEWFFLRLRGC